MYQSLSNLLDTQVLHTIDGRNQSCNCWLVCNAEGRMDSYMLYHCFFQKCQLPLFDCNLLFCTSFRILKNIAFQHPEFISYRARI